MNIKTAIEAETPIETVAANIVDLTRILGIFLDNAIEAALEIRETTNDLCCYSK